MMGTRKSSTIRWVAFFLAMLSIALVTFAAATHEDDGPRCMLCKLGHEPIELAAAAETPHAPLGVDPVHAELEPAERVASDRTLEARAPPN